MLSHHRGDWRGFSVSENFSSTAESSLLFVSCTRSRGQTLRALLSAPLDSFDRSMSFLSRASPPNIFPTYMLPSLPFRRRKSSTETNSSAASSPSFDPIDPDYLSGHTAYLRCGRCAADLCLTSAIVSRGFTGRWGRAYLVSAVGSFDEFRPGGAPRPTEAAALPNTNTHKPVPRQLVTGAHTVSDVSCAFCDYVLGWKYVAAEEESQKYKVGKYILETRRVSVATCWEHPERGDAEEEVVAAPPSGSRDGSEAVEFDSQDEDECEDLFSGLWTQSLALKRRQARKFGRDGRR